MKRSGFKRKSTWKRLNPIGKRKREETKIRNAQWPAFLEQHPYCEIRSRVCTGRTQCRHHARGRIGKAFLEEKDQFASCYDCNLFLETAEGKIWGKENGFRLDRLGNLDRL